MNIKNNNPLLPVNKLKYNLKSNISINKGEENKITCTGVSYIPAKIVLSQICPSFGGTNKEPAAGEEIDISSDFDDFIFEEQADKLKLDSIQKDMAFKLYSMGVNPVTACKTAKEGINTEQADSAKKLIAAGMRSDSAAEAAICNKKEDIDSIIDVVNSKSLNLSKFNYIPLNLKAAGAVSDFDIRFKDKNVKKDFLLVRLQCEKDVTTFEGQNVIYTKSPDETDIKIMQTINPDGSTDIEKTEKYKDGSSKSWHVGGKSSFYNYYDKNDLKMQVEYKYNDSHTGVDSLLVTKKSDLHEGIFEKTMYPVEELKKYPEHYDIIEGLKNGEIKGGKKLCEIIPNKNGTITYKENIEKNGLNIKRTYTNGINGIDYDYHYIIEEKDGTKILDTALSFVKNSDNKTTTILNGEKYIAEFDDTTQKIKITDSCNEVKIVDISSIKSNNLGECWNVCKLLPINLLETLKNISQWTYIDENINSEINTQENIVEAKDDMKISAHEL
ncbi:MAG: hypothetical protein LUG16_01535, partial [Candidatus Gastranaerophilales bacterium]|nr:hypothetical protein [Candidatus Gastranaerophilales bacterium]